MTESQAGQATHARKFTQFMDLSKRLFLLLTLASTPFAAVDAQDAPAVQDAPATQRPATEDLLAYADLLFSREQFPLAAQQYRLFIEEFPKSPNLQIAWFRLGECYLKVQQPTDAVSTFNHLIATYKTGPFVGSSAYRVAVIQFNAKDYPSAVNNFKIARDQLTEPEAKLQSRFYYARSLQLNKQTKAALDEFKAVVEAKPVGENPFHERSLLESARINFDAGNTEEAAKLFADLATTASTKEIKEEAVVRGGLLAAEAGNVELSEKLLSEALKFSDASPWKSLAQVGSIFNAFAREDYDRVISLYNAGSYTAPGDSRAKLLLVVGHSFRMKGDVDNAVSIYGIVESRYPNLNEGTEAAYRKLQLLYQTGDDSLGEVAQTFTDNQTKINPKSPFIDMAYLMKAEWHFGKAENSASGKESEFAQTHFQAAAAAYSKVRTENIDEKYQEARLYKQGWSEIESGKFPEGSKSLSEFIQQYPKSPLAPSALAKRAMAYQAQGDHDFALGDYRDIVTKYPEAKELEFAMQQQALILAHQNKTEEMIAAYEALIAKFPQTEGLGEAHYWIGVGNFNLENYAEALPHLIKARELDPQHDDKASLRIVFSYYHLDQIEDLTQEARRYIEKGKALAQSGDKTERVAIPVQVLEFLGRKLATSKDHAGANYFLSQVCDPQAPHNASLLVWRTLADSRMQLSLYQEAVEAYDAVLRLAERPSERAFAYLEKGQAQFKLKDHEGARSSVQESLRSQKEGRTNALARILLGDIAAADGKLDEAVREYHVVSQIFSDPEVTPDALSRAIAAYRSLGQQDKAEELTLELRTKFPNFQQKAGS